MYDTSKSAPRAGSMIDKLNFYTEPTSQVAKASNNKIKILGSEGREWQTDALAELKGRQFSVIVAPCGSGKATVQVGLAIEDINDSAEPILQLFIVPQTHIAEGFFALNGTYRTLQINGTDFALRISRGHNFASKNKTVGDITDRLVELLTTDRAELAKEGLSGLFAVASHAALRLAWAAMSDEQKTIAIHNLHLRIDESHHTNMDSDSNQLGTICKYIVDSDDSTAKLTMSTATDFRGDSRDTVSQESRDKFTYYHLDWMNHWNSLGIANFSIEIQEFEKVPMELLVKNICSEKTEHHYVAVPPKNIKWRSRFEDDSHGIDALIADLKKAWPDCRILNLVDDDDRADKKAALLNEGIDPQFDVVITCMLGREGTDWIPCSRMHVTYIEGSLTLAVQTVGRMLRAYDGKKSVVARYYYPAPIFCEGKSKDEMLNDRKNALLTMLQWEEKFYPIVYSCRTTGGSPSQGVLRHVMGSNQYKLLKDTFIDAIIDAGIAGPPSANAKEIDQIIETVLSEFDIPADHMEGAIDTLRTVLLRSANIAFRGVNISFIRENGFAQLWEKLTDDDKALLFDHNPETMKHLKSIMQKAWDEMFEEVKKCKTPEELTPKQRQWVLAQKAKAAGASE